jgi:radical SAM protein with 4Fe4S-binding SPASM domain
MSRIQPIKFINFSLSNRCNAKCVWCPTARGLKNNFDLPKDIAFKLIDEAAELPAGFEGFNISENGEPFYNKDVLEILRYIKKKTPNAKVLCLSNFGLMSKKVTETICKEQLLTDVGVNIDGHDEESYHAVKGIPFKSVIKNFRHFVEMRELYHKECNVGVNVMPAAEYAQTVKLVFGKDGDRVEPGKLLKYSNRDLVEQTLREWLPEDIPVVASKSGLWAERKHVQAMEPRDRSALVCPMLDKVQTQVYVAPNGDWYSCCLDDDNDIVFGNLKDHTIEELAQSEKRLTFLEKLRAGKFDEIGYPCNTVEACYSASIGVQHAEMIDNNLRQAGGYISA